MSRHDRSYDQVAVPSAGGTIPAHKLPDDCDDALGDPSRLKRGLEPAATVRTSKEAMLEQNKSNGLWGSN